MRPPFALERLQALDEQQLRYRLPKPRPDGCTALTLTPLELIQRLTALTLLLFRRCWKDSYPI